MEPLIVVFQAALTTLWLRILPHRSFFRTGRDPQSYGSYTKHNPSSFPLYQLSSLEIPIPTLESEILFWALSTERFPVLLSLFVMPMATPYKTLQLARTDQSQYVNGSMQLLQKRFFKRFMN